MNLDEAELQGDPKYRAYAANVDKALRGFEYSSEWADLISALGKLIKVLQANSRYTCIPKRLVIGKRLAQCTHPALPSGVHLKALETYSLIFRTIGPKQLCHDMFIYSAGIFPLLSYAAMPVKPKLLELYEEYYLPLGEHLKPALTGLLQGILPGLEEGSEHSERTNALLEQLCAGMVKSNFYSALWESVLTSPTVRLPAINFVLSQINNKSPMSEQKYLFGSDTQLLVKSVCAALYDTVVLVQRSTLDLVLMCFPLCSASMTLSHDQLTELITATLNTLLRRDMSLNRRLFTWLLGDHDASGYSAPKLTPNEVKKHKRSDSTVSTSSYVSIEDQTIYFETHSRNLLIEGLKKWLHDTPKDTSPGETDQKVHLLKPYRLLNSLLDKPEVGQAILDDILIEVFRALYEKCTLEPRQGSSSDTFCGIVRRKLKTGSSKPTDLIKNANQLFNNLEQYFIWEYVGQKFEICCRKSAVRKPSDKEGSHILTCSELCVLVDFLLDIVSLESYAETPTEYLPQLLCKITMSLTNNCSHLSLVEIHDSLQLCLKLMTKVQPSMVLSPHPLENDPLQAMEQEEDLPKELLKHLEGIENDYEMVDSQNIPVDTRSLDQDKDEDSSSQERKVSVQSNTTEEMLQASEASSESTETLNSANDEDNNGAGHRSLDRLASNPSVLSNSSKRHALSRPTSLADPSDSPGFQSIVDIDDPLSPMDTKFSEKLTHSRSLSSASLTLPESETPPMFIMQACVQCYQNFFSKFLNKKILPGSDTTKSCMKKLHVSRRPFRGTGSSEQKKHSRISSYLDCLEGVEDRGSLERTNSDLTSDSASLSYLGDISYECNTSDVAIRAFSTACNLLVEFACFPMYCNESFSAALLRPPKHKGNLMDVPDWLQVLLTSSCFVQNFTVQTTAISTILELIAMTKSVVSSSESNQLVLPNPPDSPKSTSGKISVVLIPAISSTHLESLNNGSTFFQRVAVYLWDCLNQDTPQHHTKSADLLHQLHNLTPDVFICENVIGNSLIRLDKGESLSAHIKFSLLWHLIRPQILMSSPASRVRTFDRSLLVMLDSLDHADSMARCVTQTWLMHAIDRGDIARLLEPILLVLLHPTTARVSVQFLGKRLLEKRKREKRQEENEKEHSEMEKKIYSISSVNGEVTYYSLKHGQKLKTGVIPKQDPVFALTSVNDKKKVVTKSNLGLNYTQPAKVLSKPLNVTVNPFSHSSLSDSDSEHGIPTVSTSAPSTLQRQRSLSSSPKDKSVASQKQKKSQRKSSMTPALESGSSKTVSMEDLSGSDVTDELSYVFNEEMEETVEEIVEGILNDIVNHIAMEIDGQLESAEPSQANTKIPDKATSPHRVQSPSSRSLYGTSRHHGKAQEEFLLEELEGVVPGIRDRLIPAQEKKTEEGKSEDEETEGESTEEEGLIKMLPNINLEMLHPLQQHILLYIQVYDTQRILYVLSRLRSILHTCSRDFVCSMSSTSVSSTNTPQLIKLQQLLARHKRCMTGRDFYVELDAEAPASFRSQTYLEILLQTCVYYVRSYYPIEGKAESSEAVSNRDVQISSMEVLELVLQELVGVVRESGRGSATFISDLLMRCKVQKAVLYCLLATVCNAKKETPKGGKAMLEISLDAPVELGNRGAQAFQLQLLKLAQTIIVLEDQLFSLREESSGNKNELGEWEFLQLKFQSQNKPLGFSPKDRFSCQGLLLTALLNSLKQYHNCHMHRHWINLITSSLSYLDQGLPNLAIPLISQVCRNLEMLSSLYNEEEQEQKKTQDQSMENVPPDHVVSMLKGLTAVSHFCLLENTSNVSAMTGRHAGGGVGEVESSSAALAISSFFGVLTRDKTKSLVAPTSNQMNTPKSEARLGILKMFPRIVSSISKMWGAVQQCEKQRDSEVRPKDPPRWSIGSPKAVRQQILELLSPIALQHSTSLLAAIGVVWSENRNKEKDSKRQVIVKPSEEQMVLVELVGAIRALPTDTLVQTIKQVLKAPPFTIRDKNQPGLEVSMLQFLFAYIQKTTSSSLRDAWPSLLSLLKEALSLNLSPTGRFLLFGILHEIVHKVYPFGDRKDQRDLQEMCQKLVEACNVIAGSSLEQTTWLRRNMTVKFSPQENLEDSEDVLDVVLKSNSLEGTKTDPEKSTPQSPPDVDSKVYSQYSVQALNLLAKYLAPFLDMIYLSDEKEKVVPLLTSIMHNVTPYLRNHSAPNVPSSRACTALLSSLSGYQYTRKAWKKDAFELFLDPAFFQMDASCVVGWKVIIDNLMTHDRTTFKDLMTRVAAFQNTSLNLFASREQEMEQRAQFLKRLDFAIFCSEMDQYTRSLPDIQERLAESLRLAQVPVVHEQVFLCFRVLLLRFSPHHLTGLWPTMISELVQVFLHLEEQLSSASNQSQDATKKSALRRVATADIASFFTSSSSGPNGGDLLRHKSWLGLYLSACKLLDLALCLPSEDLPQFQVYKWAFVGENPKRDSETQFIPHVARVAKLLRAKQNNGPIQLGMDRSHVGRPYLAMTLIKSIDELLPFFNSLCSQDHSYRTTSSPNQEDSNIKAERSTLDSSLRSEEGGFALSDKDYIERLIEKDFIVPLS